MEPKQLRPSQRSDNKLPPFSTSTYVKFLETLEGKAPAQQDGL